MPKLFPNNFTEEDIAKVREEMGFDGFIEMVNDYLLEELMFKKRQENRKKGV